EREQHLHQRSRVDTHLLGEVGQGGAARQPDGLAAALADADTADRRGLHLLEFLTARPLGLATATRGTARTPEGTLGAAALARPAPAAGPPATGPAAPRRPAGTAAEAAATGSTGAGTGTSTRATATRGAAGATTARRTGTARTRTRATGATAEG